MSHPPTPLLVKYRQKFTQRFDWLNFLAITTLIISTVHPSNTSLKNVNKLHLKEEAWTKLSLPLCNHTDNVTSRTDMTVVWVWASLSCKPDPCNIGKDNKMKTRDIAILPPWSFVALRTKQSKRTPQRKKQKTFHGPPD